MYLGEQLKVASSERLRLSAQLGVEGVVIDARPNEALLGDDGAWTADRVAAERKRIEAHGLKLDVLALDVGSVLLDSIHHRERADATARRLQADIRAAAAGGVSTVKYNLQMVGITRTGTAEGRGGVRCSVFRAADYVNGSGHRATYWATASADGGQTATGVSATALAAVEAAHLDRPSITVSADQAWCAIEYLVEQILPLAEREGVRLAAHPQDPAFPEGGVDGVEHVVGSLDGIRRFLALGGSSPFHGLNFCQGTIGAMSNDPNAIVQEAIREFGKSGHIFMVHFRNIVGGYLDFTECFPDEGAIDMALAIQGYREVGYCGPLCPDHVPLSPLDPGRERFFAFALGYTRALMQTPSPDAHP